MRIKPLIKTTSHIHTVPQAMSQRCTSSNQSFANHNHSTFFRPAQIAGVILRTKSETPLEAAKRLRKWVFNSSSDLEKYRELAKHTILPKSHNSEEDALVGMPVARKHLSDGSKSIAPISYEEALNANMMISLGAESGDNAIGIAAGIREFNHLLFSGSHRYNSSFPMSQFAYYHPLNRYDHYSMGLHYFNNHNYFDKHSLEFALKYLVPRIYNKSSSQLNSPAQVKPFLMCGFSIGARDNAIYLNALIYYLRNHFKLDDNIIKLYLKRIFLLNIGMAVKWDIDSDLTCDSLNFLSLDDMGTLKPLSLFNAIYANHSMTHCSYKILHRSSQPSNKEYLAVIGHGQTPIYFWDNHNKLKLNPNGHILAHYVRAIEKSPLAKLLEIPRKFLDEYYGNQLTQECLDMIKESEVFPAHRNPSLEEIEALEHKWSEYIMKEEAVLEKFHNNTLENEHITLKASH